MTLSVRRRRRSVLRAPCRSTVGLGSRIAAGRRRPHRRGPRSRRRAGCRSAGGSAATTCSAICFAAPSPPPLGFHATTRPPGLMRRGLAKTTTPTIAAPSDRRERRRSTMPKRQRCATVGSARPGRRRCLGPARSARRSALVTSAATSPPSSSRSPASARFARVEQLDELVAVDLLASRSSSSAIFSTASLLRDDRSCTRSRTPGRGSAPRACACRGRASTARDRVAAESAAAARAVHDPQRRSSRSAS